jgi:hypothetical protein
VRGAGAASARPPLQPGWIFTRPWPLARDTSGLCHAAERGWRERSPPSPRMPIRRDVCPPSPLRSPRPKARHRERWGTVGRHQAHSPVADHRDWRRVLWEPTRRRSATQTSVRKHQPKRSAAAWQQWQRSTFARVRSRVHRQDGFCSTMRPDRTSANRREPPLRIDKLGVTGSSPVPPTCGCCWGRTPCVGCPRAPLSSGVTRQGGPPAGLHK